MRRFYSIHGRVASVLGGLLMLGLLGCAPATPALPPAVVSVFTPSPEPAAVPPATPTSETAAFPSPVPPSATPPGLASAGPAPSGQGPEGATPPTVPTVPLPDPDFTAWPGPIQRFETEAVLSEFELAGPVIGFHLTRDQVTFRVHYTPGEAHYIREWALDLSRTGEPPLLVIPGGFFTEDLFAQGLLVSDGYTYSGPMAIGGVFTVQGDEPDIRWLEPQPIQPDEQFDQAVQAFPVYVSRGRVPQLNEHDNRAPRTVIVETNNGDFVVLLSLTSLFRTIDLPTWLLESDLQVYNALNLDGGRSAGYWASEDDYYDSFVPLPAVIAVYAK